MTIRIDSDGADVRVWVKAVPGASRDAIAGTLGDRLKIRVQASPVDGQANRAICRLLARALGVKASSVRVDTGHTAPEKILRIRDVTVAHVITCLGND